jgi:hypothetical protein
MMNTADTKMGAKELREFGLVTGGMLALIFGLLLPWIWDAESWPLWPWITAAVLALIALAIPRILQPVYHWWMKLAHVLGWVNTRILLSIVFFLIFLPVGAVLRLLGKDPMARKLDRGINSYRVESKAPPENHMERPF